MCSKLPNWGTERNNVAPHFPPQEESDKTWLLHPKVLNITNRSTGIWNQIPSLRLYYSLCKKHPQIILTAETHHIDQSLTSKSYGL